MSLLKWDTFGALGDVLNRLKRIFWRPLSESGHEMLAVGDWMPPVKISQTNTAYLIRTEIPEVKREDVQVTIQNGMLTIQGKRKLEEKGKKHRARSCNSFVHSFRMPDDADEANVETEFKDGMINITLPKTQMAKTLKTRTGAINIPAS